MTGFELVVADLPGLIAAAFLFGFCASVFLVLLVSALEAVIHAFQKIVSGKG